jgi:hypothetical protein
LKNEMKNMKAQTPDEADVYRALARAVEDGDPRVEEAGEQPMPKRPPTTVSVDKLRKLWRHIDH